jgi:hypothetical protein
VKFARIAERGLEPAERETYANAVRQGHLSATRTVTRSDSAARRPDRDRRCSTAEGLARYHETSFGVDVRSGDNVAAVCRAPGRIFGGFGCRFAVGPFDARV